MRVQCHKLNITRHEQCDGLYGNLHIDATRFQPPGDLWKSTESVPPEVEIESSKTLALLVRSVLMRDDSVAVVPQWDQMEAGSKAQKDLGWEYWQLDEVMFPVLSSMDCRKVYQPQNDCL